MSEKLPRMTAARWLALLQWRRANEGGDPDMSRVSTDDVLKILDERNFVLDDAGERWSVSSFVAENLEYLDDGGWDDVLAILKLRVGATCEIGPGGASGTSTVRRTA